MTGVSYFKADGVTALTQSFGYDADSNRTSFSDTDVAQTTVSYDHLNRVSTVTAPSPLGTTSSAYFLDGALNTVTDATGTTTFTEDHIGRVATMVDPLNPTGSNTTTYSFDAAARLTGRTEANAIVTTAGYSGADQLASKTEVAGSTTLASWSAVTYDLAQNRTGETLTYYASNPYPDPQAGSATYKYDSVNQLSQSSIPGQSAAAFGFDAAHNLTSNAGNRQAYNNNESLQTVAAATVGSDADGNQQKDVVGNILSWNSLSQFEQFSTTETYAYDALGRLTKVSNGSNVTQFVYRGLSGQVVEELNGSGGVIRSYAWDTLGRQLYVKAGTTVYYEITDPHGDVAALASGTALVGTAHFDPWGNPFTPNGTTTPFGFQGAAGSWSDATSGFVSMGVRWYYPKVGRFLSRDPAAGTANPRVPLTGLRWLYGLNSPLIHSDPTGLDTQLDNSGGCDAACQGAAAPPAAAPPPAQQAATPVCGRGGCVSMAQQNPVDWCNLGGLHWCAAGNALGNQQVSVDQYQANEIAAGIQDSIMGMGRTGQAVANCQHGDWSACQVLGSGVAHTVMHPGGLIDYEDLSNGRYGRWVGHIIPAILMAGVTVGAGGLLAGGTAAATEATSADLATATAEASASEVAGAAPKLLTGGGVNSWEGGITSTITDSPTTMWRVWGGGSGRTGQWLSTVKPTNAFEAQEGLALPPGNTATFLSQVVVPAGVRIQIGQAAGIWGRAGGWEQVQLLDKIPAGSFGEGSVLTPLLEAAFP